MPLLSKSIYGCEIDAKKTPFGFLNHQIRLDGLLNSAGWFNSNGEKLGFGDLTIQDLHKVSSRIPKDESFIVLSEFDTRWSIPSHLDSSAPGIDYVMQNCLWFVCSGSIYRIKDSGALEKVSKDGIDYVRCPRQEFYKFTGYNVKKVQEPTMPSGKTTLKEISQEDFDKLIKQVKQTVASKKLATKSPLPTKTVPAAGSGKYIGYAPTKTVKLKPKATP